MDDSRAVDPFRLGAGLSGSNKSPDVDYRDAHGIRRAFELGDLVTLSPNFRYSIAITEVDFGRYIGIVTQAYSNYEYMVVWTSRPSHMSKQGLFNGDHLVKLEYVDETLNHKKL